MKGSIIGGLHWGVGTAAGPAHIKANRPNQDAYALFASNQVVAAAVADGLGSCPFSHHGARWAAAAAVTLAVDHLLTDSPTLVSPQHLEGLKARIISTWRSRFGQKYADFDSTLHLVALTDDRAILAQIGDGLILSRTADGSCSAFSQAAKPFLNITESLAHPEASSLFRLEELVGPSRQSLDALFLMTDGVADDLEDPAAFCSDALGILHQTQGLCWGQSISTWLQEWPRPGHSDDKTLLVISFGGADPTDPGQPALQLAPARSDSSKAAPLICLPGT